MLVVVSTFFCHKALSERKLPAEIFLSQRWIPFPHPKSLAANGWGMYCMFLEKFRFLSKNSMI